MRARRPARALLPALDALAVPAGCALAGSPPAAVAVYTAAVLLVLGASGAHRLRMCLRVTDELPRLLGATAVPVCALLPWLPGGTALRTALASSVALLLARAVCYAMLRRVRLRGLLAEPTLIVGTGATAVELALILRDHRELGMVPAGFLDDRPPREGSFPGLGPASALAEVVAAHGIRRVIVSFADVDDAELVGVLRAARPLGVDVTVVPRLHELGIAVPRYRLDDAWGIPLLPLRQTSRFVLPVCKRLIDTVLAALLLVSLAPLLAGLAAAVRISAGAPVLFRQARTGLGGRTVVVPKLRTLAPAHDEHQCWQPPRHELTALGRRLRATHLDELPQLYTVLRGRMSLVGPRPERPRFALEFGREIPRYDDRHRAPPGMTGWAQVHGLHGDTSIPERARFDNQYVEYWSPWLDLVILARTLGVAVAAGHRTKPTAMQEMSSESGVR